MTDKVIVTPTTATDFESDMALESAMMDANIPVEGQVASGVLVDATDVDTEELQNQGLRVKVLPDTNLLHVGAYTIDIEGEPPEVPSELEIPSRLENRWRHHLVQLISFSQPDWVEIIEARGITVVEPISGYGLFVVGDGETVAGLEELPFVAWTGPFEPAYRVSPSLLEASGTVQVSIGVYGEEAVPLVREEIGRSHGTILFESAPQSPGSTPYYSFTVTLQARSVNKFAKMIDVRWVIEELPYEMEDERSAQIVVEDLNGVAPPNTGPNLGYANSLLNLGVNGAGVTIGICDSGIDTHSNATMHPDLAGRQTFFADQSGGATTQDVNGHGTHVAGIALGNATTPDADPQGFRLGQGMAPNANFGSVNAIGTGAPSDTDGWIQTMVTNGAEVMNNSWGGGSGGGGYTARCRIVDQHVRDPNPGSAALDYLAIVFSAGNSGGMPTTVTDPKEAKNIIVVGNSLNARPGERFPNDDIRGIASTSSRGPAVDGRLLPTIVAPGTDIISTRSSVDANPAAPGVQPNRPAYTDTGGAVHNQHTPLSGTSMATPHVSGTCALLIEWWRSITGGQNPSPAMLKALLVNGAEDMAGGPNWKAFTNVFGFGAGTANLTPIGFTPAQITEQSNNSVFVQYPNPVASAAQVVNPGNWFYNAATDTLTFRTINATAFRLHVLDAQPLANVPNNDQGWGRVSLENIMLQNPDSDRGPKIFSDQNHAFTANGQEWMIRVAAVDPARPMRITVAWTDAAAAANANPARVNDLDLEVTELSTGNVYRGNVFNNGFSTTGGAFDNLNNVECVYLLNPTGQYEVRVIGSNIAASARPDLATPWQDFAIVIDNADVPSADPVSVVPVIDRSSSMVSYGYVDVTRTSSKQFVDLLSVNDELGVVSFGNDGQVEYPTGAGPTIQAVTGQPALDAAKMEIDGIVFDGCTNMGDGIIRARDLLAGGTAARRAMVLLSDGYDNRGNCGLNPAPDPAAITAAAAAATLPADVPIYTCAMGPLSDQNLLAQLANDTDGRYYFMPSAFELFEIYNYIRGQITGEGVFVNESSAASESRVGGYIDALATEATLTVTWAAQNLRYVAREPRNEREINVRLRDPNGRLLPQNSTRFRRKVGEGYVAFELDDPLPGRWFVEVKTERGDHVQFTVGGFVKSPLQLRIPTIPLFLVAGTPLQIASQVLLNQQVVTGTQVSTTVKLPKFDLSTIRRKFRQQLSGLQVDPILARDGLPLDIAKIATLDKQIVGGGEPSILNHVSRSLQTRELSIGRLGNIGLAHLGGVGIPTPVAPSPTSTRMRIAPVLRPTPRARPTFPVDPLSPMRLSQSGVSFAQLNETETRGSYNIIVNASGVEPETQTRFVRKEMVSALVR